MESGPQPQRTEADPRRKDGQGLDFWAESLLKNGLISHKDYEEFIAKNNSKEQMMEDWGLPQLRHHGVFNSVHEIREKLSSLKDERFIIRCSEKETGDISRLIDTDLDGACEFAEKLPGGFEKWNVEMKEFVKTRAAGTIVVEPSGRTSIEAWEGPHYLNTTNVPKYYAEYDPDQFHHRFHWRTTEGAPNLAQMQSYALQALRYAFPHLKPKPNEPIYIEYGVRPNGQVYFIEANDSELLTGAVVKKHES